MLLASNINIQVILMRMHSPVLSQHEETWSASISGDLVLIPTQVSGVGIALA